MRLLRKVGLIAIKDTRSARFTPDFSNAGPIPSTVSGMLRVSVFSADEQHSAEGQVSVDDGSSQSTLHRHVWINGPDYTGMEDNDLRGFLDGRFVAAWNQAQQVHVRLGRKPKPWAFHGNRELFRVLQRWSDILLPSNARVDSARLEIYVETGVARPLEVLLYEVHKDWQPGDGGRLRNNVSPPSEGEVWWNEVAHKKEAWGLPGAGFASDSHPYADTPIMPLAVGRYRPGDSTIAFESPELADYVEKRVTAGQPLLFLLKLSDYLEDIPGTSIDVYSGNHGDDRNTARRPRLLIDWGASGEIVTLERHVQLEHGRSMVLPVVRKDRISSIAASFDEEVPGERPSIHIRTSLRGTWTDWRLLEHPYILDADAVEIRINAVQHPVRAGTRFTAGLRDTWVTTGTPEEQEVLWTFMSPSGNSFSIRAEYEGDWRWRVQFTPHELGRWTYNWKQNFTGTPYESSTGIFDVVPGDRQNALRTLEALTDEMRQSDLPAGRQRAGVFEVAFNRLLRALMRFETPETFPLSAVAADDGGELGERLDEARAAMGGRRPDSARLKIEAPDGVTLE